MCIQSLFIQEDSHWCVGSLLLKSTMHSDKIKHLLSMKSKTQKCIHFYETLLVPITMWAFQLHKPLKYLKSQATQTNQSLGQLFTYWELTAM